LLSAGEEKRENFSRDFSGFCAPQKSLDESIYGVLRELFLSGIQALDEIKSPGRSAFCRGIASEPGRDSNQPQRIS
jgi:hypothetical protein